MKEGWARGRLKWDAELVSGGTPATDETAFWLDGEDPTGVPFVAIGDMSRRLLVKETAKRVSQEGVNSKRLPVGPPGTILLAMYASVGEVSRLSITATWNQAILGISPDRERVDPQFLTYYLLSARDAFLSHVRSNTQSNLNAGQVGDIWYSRPPLTQQRAIADFLDREIAQIDTLIVKQEQLIATLRERRHSEIARATGWTDPLSPGWVRKRLSWIFATTGSGTTPAPEDTLNRDEAEIGWITSSELRETPVARTQRGVMREVLHRYSALKVFPPGSLLVAMYGATIGRMGILEIASTSNQACCALVGADRDTAEFVQLSLLAARDRLLLAASGGGQPNINQETLRAFQIPLPPSAQLVRIVRTLQEKIARTDALVTKANDFISLAKERRAALITAAVTGEISVSSAA